MIFVASPTRRGGTAAGGGVRTPTPSLKRASPITVTAAITSSSLSKRPRISGAAGPYTVTLTPIRANDEEPSSYTRHAAVDAATPSIAQGSQRTARAKRGLTTGL